MKVEVGRVISSASKSIFAINREIERITQVWPVCGPWFDKNTDSVKVVLTKKYRRSKTLIPLSWSMAHNDNRNSSSFGLLSKHVGREFARNHLFKEMWPLPKRYVKNDYQETSVLFLNITGEEIEQYFTSNSRVSFVVISESNVNSIGYKDALSKNKSIKYELSEGDMEILRTYIFPKSFSQKPLDYFFLFKIAFFVRTLNAFLFFY